MTGRLTPSLRNPVDPAYWRVHEHTRLARAVCFSAGSPDVTDRLRPVTRMRSVFGSARTSLWARPGQRDLTSVLLGGSRPATAVRAREWALVLTARGIPHVLKRQGDGYRLLVPRRRAGEALSEIVGYAAERDDRFLPDPEVQPHRPTVWPEVLGVVGALTGVFGLLLGGATLFGRPVAWRAVGAGDSAAMLAGQWWRAFTALCLHADPAHLLGNAACGGLFLSFLCRETGLGLGFAMTLAAGAAGNVLKVLVQGPGMHFLGASTAVFGALGAIGGLRLAEGGLLSFRRSAPVGAVLMLLAMLGAGTDDGKAVDLAGHLFGFVSGAGLGAMTGLFFKRRARPGPLVQAALGGLALVGLALAWGLAIRHAGA